MCRLLRLWPWAALAVMAACILAMNIWCVPSQDELAYAFTGMARPIVEPIHRVSSITDIVAQQVRDYVTPGGNGRVFIHSVVAFFVGFRLYTLFDALNTAMWFSLVWLVLHEGGMRRLTARTFLLGACVVWWALWYAETCSTNAAYAVNYLWTACATMAMMALWRRANTWWWVPVAFFYGWSQESFVLPMLVALAGGAFLRSVAERRLALTPQQAVAWLLMLAGACFLCLSPSASARAGGLMGAPIGKMVARLAKVQADVVFYPSALLLFLVLGGMLWRRRKTLPEKVMREPEWWLFAVAAYGLYTLCQSEGSVRLLFSCLLACTVLLVRHRDVVPFRTAWRTLGVGITLCWMMGATLTQVRVGQDISRMCATYATDVQGLTWRPACNLFPFLFSCDIGPHSRDNLLRFQWETGRTDPPMIVLSPELYAMFRDVSANKGDFFGRKAEVFFPPFASDSRINVRPEGAVGASPALPRKKDWRTRLPGRFRLTFFPTEDCFVSLPEHALILTALDGTRYVVTDLEDNK